jgi:hypothetical protein
MTLATHPTRLTIRLYCRDLPPAVHAGGANRVRTPGQTERRVGQPCYPERGLLVNLIDLDQPGRNGDGVMAREVAGGAIAISIRS